MNSTFFKEKSMSYCAYLKDKDSYHACNLHQARVFWCYDFSLDGAAEVVQVALQPTFDVVNPDILHNFAI